MNDFDPLRQVRQHENPKSEEAAQRWLSFRASQGMAIGPMLDRFNEAPAAFARQWARRCRGS